MNDPFAQYAQNIPNISFGPFGIGSFTDAQIAELAKNNMLDSSGNLRYQPTATAGAQEGTGQDVVEEATPAPTGGKLDLPQNAQTLYGVNTPLYQGGPIPEFRYLDTSRQDYLEEMRRQQDALRQVAGTVQARTPTDLASAMQQARDEYADYGVNTFARGGLATLANQEMADNLARMGRYDDDQIAHVAEGEVIVPAPIMKYYPEVKDKVFEAIREEGLDPEEFIVGGDMVARNPRTGVQEFGFFSKVFKKVKKLVKKFAPVILAVALPGIGTALGTSALGYASVAQAALTGGIAGLGGGLIQGKGLKDSLKMGAKGALLSGATAGLTGQPLTRPDPVSQLTPSVGIETVKGPTIDSVGGKIDATGSLSSTVSATPPATPSAPFDPKNFVGDPLTGEGLTLTPELDTSLISTVTPTDQLGMIPAPESTALDSLAPRNLSTAPILPSEIQVTTPAPVGTLAEKYGVSAGSGIVNTAAPTFAADFGGITTLAEAGTQAGVQAAASEAAKEGFLSGIRSGVESFTQDPGQFLQDAGADYFANLQAKPISTLSSTAGIAGLGAGLMSMEEEQDQTPLESPFDNPLYDLTVPGEQYFNTADPRYQALLAQQQRGIGRLLAAREGGEIVGPGTGTSDSIPALLSDGEFVMTAKAVKGAGNGDRRLGAAKMYDMMAKLESNAA